MRVHGTVATLPEPVTTATDGSTIVDGAALFAALLGGTPTAGTPEVAPVDASGAAAVPAAAVATAPATITLAPAPDGGAVPDAGGVDPTRIDLPTLVPPANGEGPQAVLPDLSFGAPSPTVPAHSPAPPPTSPTGPEPAPSLTSPSPHRADASGRGPEAGDDPDPLPPPPTPAAPTRDVTTPAFGRLPVRAVDAGAGTDDQVVAPPAIATPDRVVGRVSVLTFEPGGPAPAQQMSEVVVELRRRGDGPHEVLVALDPPELGRVSMKVRFDNGSVHIELLAQHSDARQLMRSQLDELRASLDAVGLPTGSLDVGDHAAPRDHSDHEPRADGAEPLRTIAPDRRTISVTDEASDGGRVDVHL